MDIDFEVTGVAALAVQQALIEKLIERGALKPEDRAGIPDLAVKNLEATGNPTLGRTIATIKLFHGR